MALEDNYGYRVALDLIKTGLQSGAIKLHGPTASGGHAEEWGQADARYLIGLMAGLQAQLPTE